VSNLLIGYLIIAVGIASTGFGAYTFFQQRKRFAQFSRANGVVVELIPVRVSQDYVVSRTAEGMAIDSKYRYRVRVQFTASAGRRITFVPSISQRPAPYGVGATVEVLYDPRNPQQAQINSFTHRWFATLMLVGFGLFGIAMGGLTVLMAQLSGEA
jgi:hypothetical protein